MTSLVKTLLLPIEVYDADRSPMLERGSQSRECRGMITTQCDNSRHSVVGRVSRTVRDDPVCCIKLLQGHGVVQHGQRSISAVNNRSPFLVFESAQRCEPVPDEALLLP